MQVSSNRIVNMLVLAQVMSKLPIEVECTMIGYLNSIHKGLVSEMVIMNFLTDPQGAYLRPLNFYTALLIHDLGHHMNALEHNYIRLGHVGKVAVWENSTMIVYNRDNPDYEVHLSKCIN